jgi:hypothetical protein
MISLALVNGLPHWPVIRWFLPCSTPKHLFAWSDSYHVGITMKTLGGTFTLMICSTQVAKGLLLDKCHIHCYIDPHCIGRGYVLSSRRSTVYFFVATISLMSLEYRSTMYLSVAILLLLSIRLWIRSVFYGGHILQVLIIPSIGMPALGFEICHDIGWMFVCSFRQVLRV